MGNLSRGESYFNVVLYLMNHGCGNDEDKKRLLCGACEHGKLDVVKELVEHHHIIPTGKHCTSYGIMQCTVCNIIYVNVCMLYRLINITDFFGVINRICHLINI